MGERFTRRIRPPGGGSLNGEKQEKEHLNDQ